MTHADVFETERCTDLWPLIYGISDSAVLRLFVFVTCE